MDAKLSQAYILLMGLNLAREWNYVQNLLYYKVAYWSSKKEMWEDVQRWLTTLVEAHEL